MKKTKDDLISTYIPKSDFSKTWVKKNISRLVGKHGKLLGESIAMKVAMQLDENQEEELGLFDEVDQVFAEFETEFNKGVEESENIKELMDSVYLFVEQKKEDDDEEYEDDDEEYEDEEEDEEEEELDEALNLQQRRKRGLIARRNKAKLQRGKKLASHRRASNDKIQIRARKQARKLIMQKLMKGRNLNDLSAAEKEKLEKRVDKMKGIVERLARKLIVTVRKKEQQKLTGGNEKKGE